MLRLREGHYWQGPAPPPLDPIYDQMMAVVPDETLVGIGDGLDTGQVMRSPVVTGLLVLSVI